MPGPIPVLYEFAIILAAGALSALVARLARIPTVVGYLVAGALIGPYALGIAQETETLTLLAQVGVALVMFALGVELSLSQLATAWRAAAIAAPLQIGLCVLLGVALGRTLGWPVSTGLLLGFALALSSTMLIVRLVSGAGRLSTASGQALIAISLLQDLAAVVMVALVPVVGTMAAAPAGGPVAAVLLRGIAVVIVVYLLARFAVPPMMRVITSTFSREVLLATVTALGLLGAIATDALGFSLAMGAFLAGLALSETPYNHEVLAEVMPLRDVFGILFFVTLGTLLDLRFVAAHLPEVALIATAGLLAKPLFALAGLGAAGYHVSVAFPAALGLGQLGEFSFVIATATLAAGIAGPSFYSLVVAAAGLTIVFSPLLYAAGPVLAALGAARWPGRPQALALAPAAPHLIVIGFGRVGRHIGDAAQGFGLPVVVVDLNPEVVAALHRAGVPALYGDASSPQLLDQAVPRRARAVAVALPDLHSSILAVRHLRRANPRLHIVARAHTEPEIDQLYAAGADQVVQAEFEASLQMIRQSLIHMGVAAAAVQETVDRLRAARYGPLSEQGEDPPAG